MAAVDFYVFPISTSKLPMMLDGSDWTTHSRFRIASQNLNKFRDNLDTGLNFLKNLTTLFLPIYFE